MRVDGSRFRGWPCFVGLLVAMFGMTVPARADVGRQPTEISVFHRDGQTFVTWREIADVFPDAVSFAAYDEIRKRNAHVRYHVYRHTAPITSDNLGLARRVGHVGVGSGYNAYLYGLEGRSSPDAVKRFVIAEEGGGLVRAEPLGPNTGLHVHTVQADDGGQYYYAVTVVERGLENHRITAENALRRPVSERAAKTWRPVLQNDPNRDRFSYHSPPGPAHVFTRWEAEPLDSRNSAAANYMVVVFPQARKPYKVDLSLHCWGASLVSCIPWVYYPDGIFVTSTDFPQSWWTGWNTDFFDRNGCARGECRGPNRYYTMKRLLSFIGWMKTRWPIDENRIMCSGNSMGGSGGKMFCLRHGEVFNYVNSWVGIGIPSGSPVFANEYEALFGPERQGLLSENGVPTWEDLDMGRWLRANPLKETPFISFSNGKNDGSIGWRQAVEFYRALRDTKRAFTFRWGQGGHGERAMDMAVDGLNDRPAPDRLDLQRNRAVPAFTNFSLDGNPGNGDPSDGDPEGAINAFQRWDPNTILDQAARLEIELWLVSGAPAPTGTTDVTLRNVQALSTRPGQGFSWKLLDGSRTVQAGTGLTDRLGLVTVPGITLRRGTKQKLVVDLSSTAPR
jgi:hypothetical protein